MRSVRLPKRLLVSILKSSMRKTLRDEPQTQTLPISALRQPQQVTQGTDSVPCRRAEVISPRIIMPRNMREPILRRPGIGECEWQPSEIQEISGAVPNQLLGRTRAST